MMVLPLASTSATPHPHAPGAVLFGSSGQRSSHTTFPVLGSMVSGTPHPHTPGTIFLGSLGQKSTSSSSLQPNATAIAAIANHLNFFHFFMSDLQSLSGLMFPSAVICLVACVSHAWGLTSVNWTLSVKRRQEQWRNISARKLKGCHTCQVGSSEWVDT